MSNQDDGAGLAASIRANDLLDDPGDLQKRGGFGAMNERTLEARQIQRNTAETGAYLLEEVLPEAGIAEATMQKEEGAGGIRHPALFNDR